MNHPTATITNAASEASTLVRLSALDSHSRLNELAIVAGYCEPSDQDHPSVAAALTILLECLPGAARDLAAGPAVEPAKVRAAAEAVARKWRLFAGRLEWNKEVSRPAARPR